MFQDLVLVTIAIIAPTISALAHPRVTPVADAGNALSEPPKPTPGPKLGLMKRAPAGISLSAPVASDGVCGFVDEDNEQAVQCPEGYRCFFWPPVPAFSASFGITEGAVDCYPLYPSSSQIVTSSWYPAVHCEAYNDGKYNTESYEITTDGTLYCGSGSKQCATYSWSQAPPVYFRSADAQSSYVAQPYLGLHCSDVETVETVYATATNGG